MRYRTQPPTPQSRPKRHTLHKIGTVNNDWQAILAVVTAWYDLKETR